MSQRTGFYILLLLGILFLFSVRDEDAIHQELQEQLERARNESEAIRNATWNSNELDVSD
jgi:low affinity Fe/Cu permease